MSLELAIQENTQALRELAQMIKAMQAPRIEVMQAAHLPTDIDVQRGEDEYQNALHVAEARVHAIQEDAAKRKKGKKEAAPAPRPLEQSAPSTGSGATDASATEAAAAPVAKATRNEVGMALTLLSAKADRATAMTVLREVGKAEKLADVDEALYGELLAALEAKING